MKTSQNSCTDYRLQQRLLALRRRLAEPTLAEPERRAIESEVAELERLLGLA